MNYLKELNAFKEWMLFHDIPPIAVLLWHTLMLLNNSARWTDTFNAPNATVEKLSGLKSQRISEARKILIDNQLIGYKPGVKGQAPIYQMKSLVSYFEQLTSSSKEQFVDANTEQYQEQSPGSSRNNHRDIHKEKEREKENRGGRCHAQKASSVYEQNFGILKPIVRDSFLAWCRDLGDELMIEAIKLAAQKGGRSYSYLESILKGWTQAGVTNVQQAHHYEQHNKKQKQPPGFLVQRKSKNQVVLDAFRRDVKA